MIIDNIHNHYEAMVMDYLTTLPIYSQHDDNPDLLQDIACVALNQLPPKYVRHSVDLVFYMSEGEMSSMEQLVKNAVDKAIAMVETHQSGPGREDS